MPKPKKKTAERMSDASVQKATGKTWPQWFTILDKFPKDKTHTERAAWLYEKHLPKGWWCQMVTVTYEQDRGLREKHQTVGGFQVSATKTLPISVNAAYQWFVKPAKQKQWLNPKDFTITSATPGKYVHIRWKDGTRVDVGFNPQKNGKNAIAVQHQKLKNAKAAKKQQEWWRMQLQKLAEMI